MSKQSSLPDSMGDSKYFDDPLREISFRNILYFNEDTLLRILRDGENPVDHFSPNERRNMRRDKVFTCVYVKDGKRTVLSPLARHYLSTGLYKRGVDKLREELPCE